MNLINSSDCAHFKNLISEFSLYREKEKKTE